MSSRCRSRLWITATVLLACAGSQRFLRAAQYPGQIAKPDKERARPARRRGLRVDRRRSAPKASRLVPVCIYDGQDLQDAGVYLAQPEPLALQSDVEYQLQHDGKPSGLFDIDTSAREQGAWVGYGKWRPLPRPKPAPAQVAKIDEDDCAERRAHPAPQASCRRFGGGGSDSGSGSESGQTGAPSRSRPSHAAQGRRRFRIPAAPAAASGGTSSDLRHSSDSDPDPAPPPDPDRPASIPPNSSSAGKRQHSPDRLRQPQAQKEKERTTTRLRFRRRHRHRP